VGQLTILGAVLASVVVIECDMRTPCNVLQAPRSQLAYGSVSAEPDDSNVEELLYDDEFGSIVKGRIAYRIVLQAATTAFMWNANDVTRRSACSLHGCPTRLRRRDIGVVVRDVGMLAQSRLIFEGCPS